MCVCVCMYITYIYIYIIYIDRRLRPAPAIWFPAFRRQNRRRSLRRRSLPADEPWGGSCAAHNITKVHFGSCLDAAAAARRRYEEDRFRDGTVVEDNDQHDL